MRWHAAGALTGGLLLALPVALLLAVRSGLLLAPPARSPDFLPKPTDAELYSFQTYKHPCEANADCEPQLACVWDTRLNVKRCLPSDCETDLDCREGYTCQVQDSVDETRKPHVRLCITLGTQGEGQPCRPLPRSKEESCQQGLICYNVCSRPCQPEQPESCPAGTSCLEGSHGSACVPQCKGDESCPQGQRCFWLNSSVSVCAIPRGPPCDLTPCPEGQECISSFPRSGGTPEMHLRCLARCGPGWPACPEGHTCEEGNCYPP